MKLELHHGFALLKEVIHIYAPIYTQEEQPLEKLKACYLNLFDTIKREKYTSVIVPSLATGFHYYLHEEVAEMVIDLLKEFCNQNKDINIIFNLYDEETKNIYTKYL